MTINRNNEKMDFNMKKDELYKYTSQKWLKSILLDGIHATSVKYLNDPYETRIDTDKDIRLCCLSRSRNQKLMWSHYAEGHRGCYIQIETPDNYWSEDSILKRVIYSSKINNNKPVYEDDIKKMLLVKDKKWQKELEVRAIYIESENSDKKIWKNKRGEVFLKVKIRKVAFGCMAEYSDDYLNSLLFLREYINKGNKIDVCKYKMVDDSFRFTMCPFDLNKEIEMLMNK